MQIKLPGSEQMLFAANLLAEKLIFRTKSAHRIERILVVKWDEIGDMATATHVFELLKLSYPKATLTVLCKPFVKNMIECDPHVDEIITHLNDWNSSFQIVVELRGTWKSLWKGFWYRPLIRVSRARVRWAHRGQQLHETDTNFEVIKPILSEGTKNTAPNLFFSNEDRTFVERFLSENNLKTFAIIHAGARKKLRQWDPNRFVLVANYLHQRHQMGVVLIGSEEEMADNLIIINGINFTAVDGIGKLSLSQLAYLCSKASFYIGNESGPLQIASVFSVPLLALFGPGVPLVFYPRHARSAVLHTILECNPCDQIHCVHPSNPCISRIGVADVLLKMDEILQG